MKFSKAFIISLTVAVFVWWAICRPYTVPMGGMEPTLYKGDKVLILNSWCDRAPEKGDMVLFDALIQDSATDNRYEEQVLARIAAMPGDTIYLTEDNLMTNRNGYVIPYNRELYAYNNRYDDKIVSIVYKYNWGNNELYSYEGRNTFLRSFTRKEAQFLKKAMTNELNIHPYRPDTAMPHRKVVIPRKGQIVKVTPDNMQLLCDALNRYEDCNAHIDGHKLTVNGKHASSIKFGRDFYWLKSENVIDKYDSRLQGFVPDDHIRGRVTVIFASSKMNGSIQWNRIFRNVK